MPNEPKPLVWGNWQNYGYRSWDKNIELRRAETPFGHYSLLRRHDSHGSGRDDVGKWYVGRPGARVLGPFPHDAEAIRAANKDWKTRVMECCK